MNFFLSKKAIVSSVLAIISGAAASQELSLGTYGGSFLESLKACHINAFEKRTGTKVFTKTGNAAQLSASVRATAGKSDFDLLMTDARYVAQLGAQGLLIPIDREKLPNGKRLLTRFQDKNGWYIAFEVAATTIAYDKSQVKVPPTSWYDLLKPEYANKLLVPDVSGPVDGAHFLMSLNRAKGGDGKELNAGFEEIKPFVKSSLVLYTQPDQVVSMFERKEIAAAIWAADRAGVTIDKGLPLGVVYPKEGGVGSLHVMIIPKGSKNVDLALQLIDQMLTPEGQACFAERQYVGPTIADVVVSPKTLDVIPYGKNFDKLWFPDGEVIADNIANWARRWNREVSR